MTVEQFAAAPSEPPGLSAALRALWHDRQGNWEQAHRIVMDEDDRESAWVHAYLHRKEDDVPNAHYWYRRADRLPATGSLDIEWASIVEALLPT